MSSPLIGQKPRFVDDDGFALAGGKVFIFETGTSTPAPIYTDANLQNPAVNPIVLNSRGEPDTGIFLADGLVYDMLVYDVNDVQISSLVGIVAPLTTGSTPFATSAETIAGASSVKAVTPAGGAAAYDRKSVAAAHTAGKSTAKVDLAAAAGEIEPNLALSNVFRHVLTGNVLLKNPINPLSGQGFVLIAKQDSTGGRSLTFDSKYKLAAGSPIPVTTPNAVNKYSFLRDDDDDTYLVDIGPGYA